MFTSIHCLSATAVLHALQAQPCPVSVCLSCAYPNALQAGINKFTDRTYKEKVKYLGLVPKGNSSRAASRAAAAARLRASAKVTVAQLEAAATFVAEAVSAVEPAPSADQAGSLAATQIFPNWTPSLPDIKQQSECGCCYAFAVTAVTEAAHFAATNEVISLSEKQVLDCDRTNAGCDGGLLDIAFEYIKKKGLTSSHLYPYSTEQAITCPVYLPSPVSKLAQYYPVKANDENEMLKALKR